MHGIVSKRAAASFIDYRSSPMIQLRGVDRRDEVEVIIAPAASAAPGQEPADTAADRSEDRPTQAASRSRNRAPPKAPPSVFDAQELPPETCSKRLNLPSGFLGEHAAQGRP